jgi:hypothetical protein
LKRLLTSGKQSAVARLHIAALGKVVAGERTLIWIWTHNLVNWVRLSTWKWLP